MWRIIALTITPVTPMGKYRLACFCRSHTNRGRKANPVSFLGEKKKSAAHVIFNYSKWMKKMNLPHCSCTNFSEHICWSFFPCLCHYQISQGDRCRYCSQISTLTVGRVWNWLGNSAGEPVWWIIPNRGRCLTTVDTMPDYFKVSDTPVVQGVPWEEGAGSAIS